MRGMRPAATLAVVVVLGLKAWAGQADHRSAPADTVKWKRFSSKPFAFSVHYPNDWILDSRIGADDPNRLHITWPVEEKKCPHSQGVGFTCKGDLSHSACVQGVESRCAPSVREVWSGVTVSDRLDGQRRIGESRPSGYSGCVSRLSISGSQVRLLRGPFSSSGTGGGSAAGDRGTWS